MPAFLAALLIAPDADAAVGAPIRLVPHRAVYDLSLVSSREARNLEGARGRIAFEFTGNACEGYTLKFRQVVVLDGAETGSRTTDLRTANHESGDGKTFRFRNDNNVVGSTRTTVDGNAEHRPNGTLSVRLTAPKRVTQPLDPDAVFPNVQMKDLIAAAREGRRMAAMKLYDGSEDGRRVYETLAVIGPPVEPSDAEKLEPAARQDALTRMPRWPVTISYFAPGREDRAPVYTLGFELYDNGISRALRLDYGDFALRGDMTRLDLLPDTGCAR